MKHKIAFTKKDLVVALLCLVFLLANLAAVGAGGRKRAKQAVCLSNLRQWSNIFASYLADHEGSFWEGWGGAGNRPGYNDNWMNALWRYGADAGFEFWCCPMANKPRRSEPGGELVRPKDAYAAWGWLSIGRGEDKEDLVAYGSYGLNLWVSNPVSKREDEFIRAGYEVKNCWKNANVKGADNIPLFFGSEQAESGPRVMDTPPPGGLGRMQRHCINRHNGAINGLFLDLSARRVPIKCLWNFKWHRYFDIYIIDPKNYVWPEWMDRFEADCD